MGRAETKDFQQQNMYVTLVLWILLCLGSMVWMLHTASNKTIVIPDAAQNDFTDQMTAENTSEAARQRQNKLVFQPEAGAQGSFCIPLEKELKAENVVIDNRYSEKELWIYIEDTEDAFYEENAVYGDLSRILSGSCEQQKDGVILKMKMDSILEYHTTMEGSTMIFTFSKPTEIYDQIVVIDPMGGGTETGTLMRGYAEKTLALQIARLLPDQMEDTNVKLYFTRLDDVNVTKEERIRLAEEVDADLYIRIGAGTSEDDTLYGIMGLYNQEYFIPEFGNIELADAVTRSVTIASSNRALGLEPVGEDSILKELTIPAMQINVGYLTNPEEGELLGQEEYRKKLAAGIADAVMEITENRTAKPAE